VTLSITSVPEIGGGFHRNTLKGIEVIIVVPTAGIRCSAGKKSTRHPPASEASTEQTSSSSEAEQNKVGGSKDTERVPATPIDLSISPTDQADIAMEPIAELAVKLTFKGVIDSARKRIQVNKNIDGPAGTEVRSPPPRLISLSTLSDKKDDLVGKRARSFGAPANEPAQPAHKKPPQYDPGAYPSFQAKVVEMRTRNQEKEKEVEDEVRRSCQNIPWTRGPLPTYVDH
jgi:hypothetical protein